MERNTDGVRIFQLGLLSSMWYNDEVIDRALAELGADRDEMAAARAETENITRGTIWFEKAPALLGEPLSLKTEPLEPDSKGHIRTLSTFTYKLPLWPDLVFIYTGLPTLQVAWSYGFERLPGRPRPAIEKPEDLQPWVCLFSEVVEVCGEPLKELESWSAWAEYIFAFPAVDADPRLFKTTFQYNLLHKVRWL